MYSVNMIGTMMTVIALFSMSGLCHQLQSFQSPVQSQIRKAAQRLDDLDKQRLQLNEEVANLSRILAGLTTTRQSTQLKSGCPLGFTMDDEASFCYKISLTGNGDFYLGSELCEMAQGGRLAVLNSELKFQVIRTAAASAKYCLWVGGKIGENGRITHWHDGSRIEDGFWAKGEPNNPQLEKCLALYQFPAEGLMLNDASCSNSCNVVCEVPTV